MIEDGIEHRDFVPALAQQDDVEPPVEVQLFASAARTRIVLPALIVIGLHDLDSTLEQRAAYRPRVKGD